MPTFTFSSDNDMLACLTHGQAQDVFWLNEAVEELEASRLPAYFVPKGLAEDAQSAKVFFAVMSRPDSFVTHFAERWNRLSQQEYFALLVHKDHLAPMESDDSGAEDEQEGEDGEWPKKLRAFIITHPDGIPELADHVKPEDHPNDLVLAVRCNYAEWVCVLEVCLPPFLCLLALLVLTAF
jgi:hypothetical protein